MSRSEHPSFEQQYNSIDMRNIILPSLGEAGYFDMLGKAFFNTIVALKAICSMVPHVEMIPAIK
jgi:hypothetical protein